MVKIWKYFFYKIYSFSLSNGETDANWAFGLVSMFIMANVWTLFDLLLIVTSTKLPQLHPMFIVAMGGLLLYIAHSFLLKNGKPEKVVSEFRKVNEHRWLLNLLLAIYILGSVVLFAFTANKVRSMN